MNVELDTRIEPQRWPTYRWWSIVGFILVIQIGFIFWLGDQGPITESRRTTPLSLQMAGTNSSELLALSDPSLLALPHRESFAGQAWLTIPSLGAEPFIWSEPPQWLKLPTEQLGEVFRTYLATNQFTPPQALAEYEPELSSSGLTTSNPAPGGSGFRILGELAGRTFLTPITLDAWINSDLLTNTIVEVVVDAKGRPVSATLLCPSGSSDADRLAIKLAEGSRFEPLPLPRESATNPVAGLSWGQFIFDWRTLPPASTNQPTGP